MDGPSHEQQPQRAKQAAPERKLQQTPEQQMQAPTFGGRRLLSLQRAAGNRAASRLVQRQQPPAAALDVSKMGVTGGPTLTGTVSTAMHPTEPGVIQVLGPEIESNHTVTANEDLPESVEVGYVQTVQSSNRVGIYGKGGTETFRRQEKTPPKSRDARPYNVKGGGKVESRAPWYDSELGGVGGLSAPSGSEAKIRTRDRPAFPIMAREQDGSALMGTEGDEKFVLSVAAKQYNSGSAIPIPQGSAEWSFSWKQTIDSSGVGSGGKGITYGSTTGEVVTSDGIIAKKAAYWWYDFQSKDAAMGHSAGVLIENMKLAQAAGADGATALASTVAALREKNPHFVATIDTQTTSSLIGSDQLSVTIRGAGGSQTTSVPGTKGKPAPIGFNLLSVCSDPLQFLSGLDVSIKVTSDWREGTVGTAHFANLGQMAAGKVVEAGSSPAGTFGITITL